MAAALALPAAASAAVSETDCNGSAVAGADQPGTFDQFWVRRGPGWTGGDQALSVRLPDGRTAWLYADTILGTVNADDTRGPGAPIVHNTVAIQDGPCVTTWHGGTHASPAPLVAPADPSSWYWPGAAVVDGGNLKVVLNEFNGTDQGLTGYTHVADFVATISLADMSVQSVQPISSPASLFWGSAILSDGGYTYIYGADQDGAGTKHAHVARVPDGSLDQTSQWTFWNGLTWVSDPSTSARVADGVSMLYSVIKTGVGYTLVSQDGFFSREIYEWQGATPAGPFPTKWDLGALPDPGSNRSAYNAILHPEFDSGGEVLLGYSVGANDLNYTDASSYRPQFASIQAPTWGVPSNLLNLTKASSAGPHVAQPPPPAVA